MRVDLSQVLVRKKSKSAEWTEDRVVDAYRELLRKDDLVEQQLRVSLNRPSAAKYCLESESLDLRNLFHESHIRELCTQYRLRFLDAHLFKGEVPDEAISKLKHLQRRQDHDLSGFKIMAPASVFELAYQDKDPMLFLPVGNGLYYLVHKWGNDMHWFRKWLVYPFRNVGTLLRAMLLFSFLFQMVIPTDIMMNGLGGSPITIRIWMTLHVFIATAGMLAMFAYPALKNFNSVLWNSRFND